ncbi:MAG: TIM barrel protein, partial [Spirochaetota bacterium]
WDLLVEGLLECADYNPAVRIAVEYKAKEPRTHCFVGSLAKALLLVKEVNRKNVGVNLDAGHALLGYESMAESTALLKRFGNKLFHLHVNDNYRYWDDDMVPGSVHTLEWIEFFFWLSRTAYEGWISLDVFAYRERDKVAVARESLAWLKGLMEVAGRLEAKQMEEVLFSGDAMKATQLVRKALLG